MNGHVRSVPWGTAAFAARGKTFPFLCLGPFGAPPERSEGPPPGGARESRRGVGAGSCPARLTAVAMLPYGELSTKSTEGEAFPFFMLAHEKRESNVHRTATTSCPCCLPALGELGGSWSCTTFPAAKIQQISFLPPRIDTFYEVRTIPS